MTEYEYVPKAKKRLKLEVVEIPYMKKKRIPKKSYEEKCYDAAAAAKKHILTDKKLLDSFLNRQLPTTLSSSASIAETNGMNSSLPPIGIPQKHFCHRNPHSLEFFYNFVLHLIGPLLL